MSFEIPFIRPVFPSPELVASDYARIVESNWYTNFGPREREFSAALGTYMGDGYIAVTFANATLALMALCQAALGRGDGSKEVLVPSFTFAAGPAAVEWAGYVPRFIDVDTASLQPSIDEARAALDGGSDVAGILLGNTFGIGNAQIAEWEQLAEEYGVQLLIDSAAGFGSVYPGGRRVGTAGLAEVFSFHATKPFAIGEGGAVVTRDPALARSLAEFQNFGFSQGLGSAQLGLNGKLQELNAAIGLRQLATIDEAVQRRQAVVAAYRRGFEGLDIAFPRGIDESSVCFASIVLPDRGSRDAVLAALIEAGVEARAYYSPAVHTQPHFAAAPRQGGLRGTGAVVDSVLSLPVHQDMAQRDIDTVIAVVARTAPRS